MNEETVINQPIQDVLHRFVKKPISELKLAEYNPRSIDEENEHALQQSLIADPEMLYDQPIVVNTYPGRENIVYIGNQRVKAAQALGWPEVPVLLSYVDPVEEKKRNIKANHHNGSFDPELLSGILVELADQGTDMGTLGYTAVDLTSAMEFEGLDPTQDPEYDGTAGKAAKEHICPQCGFTFKEGQTAEDIATPTQAPTNEPGVIEYAQLDA